MDIVRGQACQRSADTKANVWGGGALEVGDLCLFEGGSKRDGTLVSEAAAGETAK